jgi:arylsulfatase A-like enzyme
MPEQPSILVVFGDDIGIANLCCHSHGPMEKMTQAALARQD